MRITKFLGNLRQDSLIDEQFNGYCKQREIEKQTERKEPLQYWVIAEVVPSFDEIVRADEAREHEAANLSDEELQDRARNASRSPPGPRSVTGSYYPRNGDVAAHVKRAAKGVCDLCRSSAPFKNHHDEPYLECHHIKPLAEHGTDTLDNTVALCPNCHRKMHVLKSASDNKRLRKRIEERDGG